jgi:hypothetical protein
MVAGQDPVFGGLPAGGLMPPMLATAGLRSRSAAVWALSSPRFPAGPATGELAAGLAMSFAERGRGHEHGQMLRHDRAVRVGDGEVDASDLVHSRSVTRSSRLDDHQAVAGVVDACRVAFAWAAYHPLRVRERWWSGGIVVRFAMNARDGSRSAFWSFGTSAAPPSPATATLPNGA